jgi:hypothetical protein
MNDRRRPVLCLAVLALAAAGIACFGAPAAASATQAANLSLFYPASTNQDPRAETHVQLAILYGRLAAVRGLEITGGVSWLHDEMEGFQIVGAYSQLDGRLTGLSLVGGVANVRGPVTGFQITGLANWDRGPVAGFQYAGLMNFTAAGFRGVQAASFVNLNDGPGGGLQLASVANVAGRDLRGFQLAGGINVANAGVRGGQIGLFNLGRAVDGVQLGLINLAQDAAGIEIGVVNVARRLEGVPIGFVNVGTKMPSAGADFVVLASTVTAIAGGVRTDVRDWRSELTVGWGDLRGDIESTVFLGWHYGRRIRLGGDWELTPDAGYLHLIPTERADAPGENDRLQFALQLRLRLEKRFAPHVSVFAGGGVGWTWAKYALNADMRTDGLGLIGVALF